MKTKTFTVLCLLAFMAQGYAQTYHAPAASQTPVVDGISNDPTWSKAAWKPIDKLTLGIAPSEKDFQGRFKSVWTEQKLYLLVEIIDDVLIDTHPNPLDHYWEDDCLEIFIDEDHSGGNHQFNYNAFAYHIALDNQAVDIGPFKSEQDQKNGNTNYRTFNQHIQSSWKRQTNAPHKVIWEVSINVYTDRFDDQTDNKKYPQPTPLFAGKKMGFMLAYCDSDGLEGRESFISSEDIPAVNGDKNRAYIDASVFGSILLTE